METDTVQLLGPIILFNQSVFISELFNYIINIRNLIHHLSHTTLYLIESEHVKAKGETLNKQSFTTSLDSSKMPRTYLLCIALALAGRMALAR